jgi:hypothetical protein
VKRTGTVMAASLMAATMAATVAAAAGCGSHRQAAAPPVTTGSSGSPTGAASGPASASPSASPQTVVEFTVDGVGPYPLGASLTALRATPGLDGVTAGAQPCPDNTVAQGTGAWKDVQLRFHRDGTLFLEINRSASIPTPSGAWLGTRVAQLKTIYASVPGEDLTRGAASAFLVTTQSGRAILFDLGPTKQVTDMIAGDGPYLKATYLSGAPDYC